MSVFSIDVGLTLVALAFYNAWLAFKFRDSEDNSALPMIFLFLSQVFVIAAVMAVPLMSDVAGTTGYGWFIVQLIAMFWFILTLYILIHYIRTYLGFMAGANALAKEDKNIIDERHEPR